MALSNYNLSNRKNNVSVDLDEYLLLRILNILYLRDKRLFEVMKRKYEDLEQKKFKDEVLKLK